MDGNYCIAIFLSTNDVAVVPRCWVEKGKCAWPPYKTDERIKKAVIDKVVVGDGWSRHSIRILGTYETYADARGKLRQAEETSDINSDACSGKRKRRKVKKFSSSSDSDTCPDDAQEDEMQNLHKLPPPPIVMCQTTQRRPSPTLAEDDIRSHGSRPTEEIQQIPDLSNFDADFKKHVMRQLSMLRSMIALNTELLESISTQLTNVKRQLNKENVEVVVPSPPVENYLNISTEEDLRSVEEELKDEPFADKMVIYLRRIGGNNASDATRRIMRRIFNDDMATEFSLTGAGSKRSFMGLRLARIVIRAVQESMSAPERDVEAAIRNWLRHAKERLQGKKKNK